jgi:hypothetical protein
VKEAVAGFFSTIDGLTHHILNVYEFGDTVIAQIDVEYRRKDGKSVTVPNADILVFDGDLVATGRSTSTSPPFTPEPGAAHR